MVHRDHSPRTCSCSARNSSGSGPKAVGKRHDTPGIVTSLKTLGQFLSMTLAIVTVFIDSQPAGNGRQRT